MRGRRLRARRLTAAVLSAGGLGALAALVVLGHAPGAGSVAEAAKRKPNVVVLMTDDQTVRDLEVMARTRRVLGGRGVTFRNSFVSYPLCCPSRATFLSGQYPHNHRVLGNRPPNGGYRRFDKGNALPVWLEQAGYRTAHIGKYLNGYGRDVAAGVEPGWTEWYGSVDPSTYLMWGYTLNENGSFRTYGRPGVENPALYQTDVYRRKAIDFIRRQRAANRPFFLSVAFLAPHGESRRSRRARRAGASVRPAPRHRGRFASKPLPRPPSFNERDVSDKPRLLGATLPRLGAAQIEGVAARFRSRQESLLSVDEAVEAIVAALRSGGLLERTYVIFTSDNGFFHGEHRVPSSKYLVYDPSSRVPLLIRGPGIRGGRRSAELVTNEDLAPTILDITGARPGKPVDGRSLLPFARRPSRRSRRPLLHETGGIRLQGNVEQDGFRPRRGLAIPAYRAVRTPRWLYVEYDQGSRELYDLVRDPHQLRSRHADRRYRRTRAALSRELRRLRRCRGRTCRASGRSVPAPRRR